MASQPLLWYCPSRWLLAHYDLQANINTLSSHMCLADLNNDGESLLALIDFKQSANQPIKNESFQPKKPAPYECRMRVYRGQQLIYNHFLDDMPSCLIASSITLPIVSQAKGKQANSLRRQSMSKDNFQRQPLLTLAINDHIYFYHKLKPSHKLSLEDEECILASLNRSEVEAWQMVRQNKVDNATMRELLQSLSLEIGSQELTSHSHNFIALESNEAMSQYLVAWKMMRLQQSNNLGEQIMSMDTVCCSAARLKYDSSITRSGDFGQTREEDTLVNDKIYNQITDIQRDGLLLGTEDRHLLIYELRSIRVRLECHYRLEATPDHILVERKLPIKIGPNQNLENLTYKVLVSCRNCRIYSINQLYLVKEKSQPCIVNELAALKSNVVDMSWTGLSEDCSSSYTNIQPYFVVACLDRRVYCFSSHSGACKWLVDLDLPITSMVCLPKLKFGNEETSLVCVASQANRLDFYVSLNGRIVDSIYFNQDDYPQAMTFGRFGREDSCLCLVTNLGRLVVLILKRTAKFLHGQCLSSAASYAAQTVANCRQTMRDSSEDAGQPATSVQESFGGQNAQLKLSDAMNLPSAFALSKSGATNVDQIDSMLQSSHNCDLTSSKTTLDANSLRPRLQIPAKGRDFVERVIEQGQMSRRMSRQFAGQMIKLRDKLRSSLDTKGDVSGEDCNRIVLMRAIGLGNIYRVSLALRLSVEKFLERYGQIVPDVGTKEPQRAADENSKTYWSLTTLIKPRKSSINNRQSQVRPFRVKINLEPDEKDASLVKPVCETTIEARLTVQGSDMEPLEGEFVPIDVQIFATHETRAALTVIQRPLFLTTINIPLLVT